MALACTLSTKVHYAWIAAGVTFLAVLAAAGVRATPGVIVLPLGNEFLWNRGTVASIVSINIVLYGLIGPFAAALCQRFGLRRMMMTGMTLIAAVYDCGIPEVRAASLFALMGIFDLAGTTASGW